MGRLEHHRVEVGDDSGVTHTVIVYVSEDPDGWGWWWETGKDGWGGENPPDRVAPSAEEAYIAALDDVGARLRSP